MNIQNLKLGKLSPRLDRRTILFRSVLRKGLPPAPAVYDFDAEHPGLDMPMFLNDRLGDCVIAARAHMTRRMEVIEQKAVIKISDAEVKKAYFTESGGADSGLFMLDSLNAWRKGWTAAGKTYSIDAFAGIDRSRLTEIKQAIYLLSGCYVGVALPLSAQGQMGKTWTVTTGRNAQRGSWGGHCIYIPGYNITGPVCITWGKRQQMTWAWFVKYVDEIYAVVDALDAWRTGKPGIDVAKLEGYLADIA